MVCSDDGGCVVLAWYVVMMVDVWCFVVCSDAGGFVVLLWYVVMMEGFWCLCGM